MQLRRGSVPQPLIVVAVRAERGCGFEGAMSKNSPLINIFTADPQASVVSIRYPGLSLPKVDSVGILADPAYRNVEGRGTYEALSDSPGRYRYVKGSGNVESLRSHGQQDLRKFPQFGHSTIKQFCFGSESMGGGVGQVAPRVRGALPLPFAVGEVLHAAVFLDILMKKEGVLTLEAAKVKGLTVPEGVVFSPAISADICEGLRRVRDAHGFSEESEAVDYKYGLASLRVPADTRLRSRDDITTTKGEFWTRVLRSPERMEMVGRVLRHQLQCGFISLSTHLQNVYDAPESLCPHADSSDLVPISEVMTAGGRVDVDREVLLQALVMRQLQYLPFNVMRYARFPELQNDAKGAIHTILSTVAPGEFTFREREAFAHEFQQKPYTVLSTIANRLIDMKLVEVSPQADWRKLRRQHSQYGYDVIAEHLIRVGIASACSLYTGIANAEAKGGLPELF